jgi:DNA-directed RNA polymerase specialized sigma subunit
MRNYPREYLWFVERVLREHPQRLQILKEKEASIIACCHAPLISDVRIEGGDSVSEQEAILEAKERDKSYQRILQCVERMNSVIRTLSKREREFVEFFFWEGGTKQELMEVFGLNNEKEIWRIKYRILRKTAPLLIGGWIEKD